MTGVASTAVELAPVRAALLARAGADADRELAAAEADAAQVVAGAQAQAQSTIGEARREGEADAAATSAVAAARTRRQARAVVLTAQREAYEALLTAGRQQVSALRSDQGWPRMRARLREIAMAAVGDGAAVTDTPDGVVAEAGSRRAVLTLDGLADRLADQLSEEVQSLWAP
jgi:vacuolar-type H+-ATPase subunit E/Vma4